MAKMLDYIHPARKGTAEVEVLILPDLSDLQWDLDV